MVRRRATDHPEKTIFSLDPRICPSPTMFRTGAAHLASCNDLARRGTVNQIIPPT